MQRYELSPQWDSRKSFYGKAVIQVNPIDGDLELISYRTRVAVIHLGEFDGDEVIDPSYAQVYGTYSVTTLRHIKEFLLQNGFKAENSKQIMADYGPKKSSSFVKTHQADFAS